MLMVGLRGEELELVGHPEPMTKQQAIELAAKLLVLADDAGCNIVQQEIQKFQNA